MQRIYSFNFNVLYLSVLLFLKFPIPNPNFISSAFLCLLVIENLKVGTKLFLLVWTLILDQFIINQFISFT